MSYGRDLARGKLVSVGEAVGMIAAQSIGEPGTQLTMRTFHVGGTAQIKEESQITSQTKGKLNIINKNLIEDSKKNIIVMGRNTQLSIEDDNGRQLAIYKVKGINCTEEKSSVGLGETRYAHEQYVLMCLLVQLKRWDAAYPYTVILHSTDSTMYVLHVHAHACI